MAQLARLYPGATVLAGERATAAGVMAAMERADVVHLADRGSFRADSPLSRRCCWPTGP